MVNIAGASGTRTRWERWNDQSFQWIGYVLLAVATVLAMLRPDRTPNERLITLGVVALAAVWIYVTYTRVSDPRSRRVLTLAFFVGLVAFGALLTTRNGIFFIFLIAAFFHASQLRPWPLTILGVFVTSVLIHVLYLGLPVAHRRPVDPVRRGHRHPDDRDRVRRGDRREDQELSDQRRELLAEREAALNDNRGLQQQLVAQAREAGVLDERSRMAREIHDTIAHGLTGVVTQLEAAEQAANRPVDWTRHVDNALRLARESLSEARRSVEASRPEALEGASLEDAMRDMAQRWSALYGINAAFTSTGDVLPLHPDIEVALLRTAQEALANVGQACRRDAGWADAFVHGRRRDARRPRRRRRVRGGCRRRDGQPSRCRDRLRAHGDAPAARTPRGTLAIESEPGGGTAISARVPAIGPAIGPQAEASAT